ncbi:MAG: EF-Tu/IF-2/RF-3 family GTPase [Chloroflexota bacterium]
MTEIEIGTISTFFARPVVAGIDLTGSLKLGDIIHIKGHSTDLQVTVTSMQINNASTEEAEAGDSVGVKVNGRVRKGDIVYKIT